MWANDFIVVWLLVPPGSHVKAWGDDWGPMFTLVSELKLDLATEGHWCCAFRISVKDITSTIKRSVIREAEAAPEFRVTAGEFILTGATSSPRPRVLGGLVLNDESCDSFS